MSKSKYLKLIANEISARASEVLKNDDGRFSEKLAEVLYFNGKSRLEYIPDKIKKLEFVDKKVSYEYQLMDGCSEIHDCFENLKIIQKMVSKFPFKNFRNDKSKLLIFLIDIYLNETYVLYLRLKSYSKRIKRLHKKTPTSISINNICECIDTKVEGHFKWIRKIRGTNVHEKRLKSKDIEHISLLELLTKGKNSQKIKKVFKLRHNEIKRRWSMELNRQNRMIQKLLDDYFEKLTPVLFAENGKCIYPSTYQN